MNTVVLHLRARYVTFETYREVCSALGDVTPSSRPCRPTAHCSVSPARCAAGSGPTGIADLIQARITARFGLTTSIGAAGTRMLATMLCDTPVPGEVRIPDHRALAFLRRQLLHTLTGVGAALDAALHHYGLATFADLAALPPATTQRIAGASTGRLLRTRSRTLTEAHTPASRKPCTPSTRPWRLNVAGF